MLWRTVVAGVWGLTISLGPPIQAEDFALLIAVGDYDRKELKPLRYTRNDVLKFRDVLLASGFPKRNVIVLHDDVKRLDDLRYVSEGQKIRHELKLLAGSVQRGDTLIVAFAGHGVQFKEESGSYFCPRDARLADRRTLIPFADVLKQLDSCAATRKLLLVDACRNDPQSSISRSRESVALESVTRPQSVKIPESLIAIFSCSAGQQSYEDPELKHGIFFHHVLEGWRGKADSNQNRELSLDELQAFVRRETTAWARTRLKTLQTPEVRAEFSGEWILRKLSLAEGFEQNSVWASPDASLRFTVLERQGTSFVARLILGNGIDRQIHGTIEGDRIAWLAKNVKARKGGPGGDNTGVFRSDAIHMQYRGPEKFSGSFEMQFLAADAVQEKTIWEHRRSGTSFTVLERRNDSFRARFVSKNEFDREIRGTITDGKVSWRATDVRAISGGIGGDNIGVIRGDLIDFTWKGPGDQSGQFTLRLRHGA